MRAPVTTAPAGFILKNAGSRAARRISANPPSPTRCHVQQPLPARPAAHCRLQAPRPHQRTPAPRAARCQCDEAPRMLRHDILHSDSLAVILRFEIYIAIVARAVLPAVLASLGAVRSRRFGGRRGSGARGSSGIEHKILAQRDSKSCSPGRGRR